MKSKALLEDLRTKSAAELNEDLVAAKKELFNLRFQNATNQLDNTSRIKEVRRTSQEFRPCSQHRTKTCRSIAKIWKGGHDRGEKS